MPKKRTLIFDKPGTIALATQEIGRFMLFSVCLSSTRQPTGSNLSIRASASVTENFNSILKDDLREEDEWVWILGDDHAWDANCLMNLLHIMDETPEADIMVPLVVKRNPPWFVVVFKKGGVREEDGMQGWIPYDWSEIPEHGTFEIDAAGSAGMVIRRSVIDAMGYPWFESSGGVYLNEDVHFCVKSKELGFRIFATADVAMGHIGVFNVHPMYKDGRWGAMTEFSSAEEQFKHIFMPGAEGPMSEVYA